MFPNWGSLGIRGNERKIPGSISNLFCIPFGSGIPKEEFERTVKEKGQNIYLPANTVLGKI